MIIGIILIMFMIGVIIYIINDFYKGKEMPVSFAVFALVYYFIFFIIITLFTIEALIILINLYY